MPFRDSKTRARHPAPNRVWQDVYHAMTPVGRVAYVKLTQINERPVVQFKET
jgi:hypothetical protein